MLDGLPEAIDLDEIDRVLARRSLAEFAKQAWHILEPTAPLKWGWALDAMCAHLEAVSSGDIKRLLMNVPPGMMKSLLTGVIWPAWEWGPRGKASLRIIDTAHKQDLAVRDNTKCRRLIQSDWYQVRWPVTLVGDQNAKTKFENAETGFREAMAFTSMTGSRGDRIILDDPLSVDDARSEAALRAAETTFTEALPTRINNDDSAIVVIMQRLHEKDTSGIILKRELGYEHLCLPMRFEAGRRCTTRIGFTDPRKTEGALLFPERFGPERVAEDERTLGAYAVAGQFQQRPAPREGGLFKTANIARLSATPAIKRRVRRWDLAATEGGGDWTAGVLLGERADGEGYVILDVQRAQKGAGAVRTLIETVAAADADAGPVTLILPQDPGQAGKAQRDSMARTLARYAPRFERETGDKETRAEPLAAQVEIGRVSVLERPWTDALLTEMTMFPNAAHDDQVDALAGAFNALAGGSSYTLDNL